MENKLELRHLAGYLPYGLKVKIIPLNELYDEKITTIEYLSEWCVTFKKAPDYYFVDDEPDIDFKPIVIPLSQLTKEQWIEVFKAGFDNTDIDHSKQFTEYRWSPERIWISYRGLIIYFNWNELAFCTQYVKFNQLAAFEKLYSLHADLHGLIEKGLGLNKNDYEK